MPARLSPAIHDHLTWLGHAQPTGLVVSPHALEALGAILPPNDIPLHRRFLALLSEDQTLPPFPTLARELLGWKTSQPFYLGFEHPLPDDLTISLPEAGETLAPDFAVTHRPLPAPESGDAPTPAERCQLLVVETDHGFDEMVTAPGRRHSHSAHARLERLLRATGVQAGLLVNPHGLRLVSAPRGESSGHVDFLAQHMAPVAGRPLLGALVMLLGQPRLLTVPASQRLPALLAHSRKHQNTVSEKLARQVLHALYELTRGIQTAHERSDRTLLTETLKTKPEDIYEGLVTVLLRMVFLLYAEERSLLPDDDAFTNHYTLGALFERLRDDNAAHPDTMDTRFGAWAQLLVQFRLVHDGADEGSMKMPARRGYLFDPERFPFLEGRTTAQKGETRFDPPEVPDGTVLRVLENLLVLDGERLSYRALDVEQIGSVYETLMGFRIETASGPSIAIKAHKAHGAPATINLEALLAVPGPKREKWLKDSADRKLTAAQKPAVRGAEDLDALQEALFPVTDRHATPDRVPAGALVLQPSDARRRSGSHYTPRSLTEPIVRKTLEPILSRLAEGQPEGIDPDDILRLKVCDPAMGSGAFLVEACRQLAEALVAAWERRGTTPAIPPDEDAVLYARREIAQRCLYGVDKNRMAADLAKLSIWLATLAKDHPFTFLDHTFRCGDSLVGLTNRQINLFTWGEAKMTTQNLFGQRLTERIAKARVSRDEILLSGDFAPTATKKQKLQKADEELGLVRLTGDLCVAAFFAGKKPKERETLRRAYLERLMVWVNESRDRPDDLLAPLYEGEKGVEPFHWEAEYPEVFGRENPGFDAVVGNPPFLGGAKISETQGMSFFQWVRDQNVPSGRGCDLAAYFFRRSYDLLMDGGTLGLIATNSIQEGDTREGGLQTILAQGGTIYDVVTRLPWPGEAAVIISTIHIAKCFSPKASLDEQPTARISAFLRPGTVDAAPSRLTKNPYFSLGAMIAGRGFLFNDEDERSHPQTSADRLIALDDRYRKRIFPYIGGSEINKSPTQQPHRRVIYTSDLDTVEELSQLPELKKLIEEKVKPERMASGDNPNNKRLKAKWWTYHAHRPELQEHCKRLPRILAASQVSKHLQFVFMPTSYIFGHTTNLFALEDDGSFCVLQSQPHDLWARFLASSMKDDPRYTASDCFETFPFPEHFETDPALEAVGKAYYEHRAALMIDHDEGLTKTYNRFHDPEEANERILRLRELHTEMDAAVLAAYGWSDVPTACDFFLDYEEPEDDLPSSSGKKKRKKKKPWRYRWPDPVRDDVLARLLELNAERAAQERREGK